MSGLVKTAGFAATSTSFFQTIANAEKKANKSPKASYIKVKEDRFGYIKDKSNFVKEGMEYR